jgi:hypothetical protein
MRQNPDRAGLLAEYLGYVGHVQAGQHPQQHSIGLVDGQAADQGHGGGQIRVFHQHRFGVCPAGGDGWHRIGDRFGTSVSSARLVDQPVTTDREQPACPRRFVANEPG